MMKKPPPLLEPLSEILLDLKDQMPNDRVSLSDILTALEDRGFGCMLFLFALPAAVPLPGLGVNVIIALPLLFLTVQQMVGRSSIWLPESMKDKSISKSRFDTTLEKSMPFVRKIEYLTRPRIGFISQGIFRNIIGFFGFVMTLSICVPLPLTNTVPAFGIALMAVGMIMRDGLAVIAGAVIGTLWVFAIFFAIIFLGVEGVELLKETIKGWI